MIQDFLIPFIAIGLAELGDKTQLAVLCLASKTKNYLQLLAGVVLAFVIMDGLAVIMGDFVTKIIPLDYIKICSGIVFIVFGILTLMGSREEESKCELTNPFVSGFSLIFISEAGDKTQIAAGLFATKFNPVMVFLGVVSALAVLSVVAVYLGRFVAERINKKMLSRIAGALFIVIGVFFFV